MAQLSEFARVSARWLDTGADWLAERLEDTAKWLANGIRFLPRRIGRVLMTLIFALVALVTFIPIGVRVWRRGGRTNFVAWLRSRLRHGAMRAVQLVLEALDIIGAPELFALFWRALTRATPLTGAEIAAAAGVLGPFALRYHDIRVAEGGILRPIFRLNGSRAFATFHTINLPNQGDHQRANMDIVLHELVHVFQYERAGSRYFAEALLAQQAEGYGYGGPAGLLAARAQGKRLRDFNREQQAQIVQDYYMHLRHGWDAAAYEPYIEELRTGKI